MSCSTVQHFSHPKHPLVLKEDNVIGVDDACAVCNKPVIGSPTYTCSSDDTDCQNFYLHKICAELPKEIIREKQDPHPLVLLPRPTNCTCDVCDSRENFAYFCDDCNFDLCVACASMFPFVSEQKVISHQGHKEHQLTIQRKAIFRCDACWEEVKDHPYVCVTCDFWIHKKCAFSPPIIPAPTYHHHPLNLIFSIPVMHRYFSRYCGICDKIVPVLCWSYYCHKCTFFVHMKCSTSTESLVNEIEENGSVDNEHDHLIEFPLHNEDSLFDLIITQCRKLQVDIQADGENSTTTLNDPHIIEEHWSHPEHPLEMQQFTFSKNELHDDDNGIYDDRRVLICDGCIQPITLSHPSYYACIQCRFFLHTFCATKLPEQLPVGACPFHSHHLLKLNQYSRFFAFFSCAVCSYASNGFYYKCEICDIKIDIRCAFLPTRIRHKSHKKHSLVPRPLSRSLCKASNLFSPEGVYYACETCSTFHIYVVNAFYPSRRNHRYDDHPISLKHPPFFYEGVIYCEICEEQVDNQRLLYHCDECDHSFHHWCICYYENVKLGGTIELIIGNQPHKLALVLKKDEKKSSLYSCVICGKGYEASYFFECNGCGYLACTDCIKRIHS